jgi:hypothetical protein
MAENGSLWSTLNELGQTSGGIISALKPKPTTTVVQAPAGAVTGQAGMSWQLMAGIGAAVLGLILLVVFMGRK